MTAAVAAPPIARADRRILVIHPGALGDVLQAVPALRVLAADGAVTLCGQSRLGALIAGAGVVHDAVSFDSFGLEALFAAEPVPRELTARLGRFERVVSWFGSRDERYPGQLRALAPGAIVAPPVPDRAHAVTVWQHLVASLGADAESADRGPIGVPREWIDHGREAMARAGVRGERPLLIVHCGAGGAWKVPPPHVLARAIAAAGDLEVVVHAGPADHEAAARVVDIIDAPARVLVEPPLAVLAGALAIARAYLGGDSGVSHLAAAVGAPAVILFPGSTLDAWTPWSRSARAVPMNPREGADERAAAALAEAISAWPRSCP